MVPLNLVPRSVASSPAAALAEWLYTGEFKDYGVRAATCDLCLEDTLRYHFRIVNQRNHNRMWLGSECITHFGILARDESGMVLDREASAAKVRRDQRKMREDSRTRRVHQALDDLAAREEGFDARKWKEVIGRQGGLRPDQALDLMRRFRAHGIEVLPSRFRVKLRHKRDRETLAALTDDERRILRPCLSARQRDTYGID